MKLGDRGELSLRSSWTAKTHVYQVRCCGWMDEKLVFALEGPLALTDEVKEAVLDSLDGRGCRVYWGGSPLAEEEWVTVRVIYGDDLMSLAEDELYVTGVESDGWVIVPDIRFGPSTYSLLDEVLS